jgi:SH3-like domain-containing protein
MRVRTNKDDKTDMLKNRAPAMMPATLLNRLGARRPVAARTIVAAVMALMLSPIAMAGDGVSPEITGAVGAAAKTGRLAAAAAAGKTGGSGLPLPRFASLKSANVNLRIGPGKEHPILWNYVKAGLPVEIVLEFDTWRKIRDADGVEGWVYQSMLSGKRTAIVEPWRAPRPDGIAAIIETSAAEAVNTVPIYAKPDDGARIVAQFEAGVRVEVLTCDGAWCSVSTGNHGGWVEQAKLWGVYPKEAIDD